MSGGRAATVGTEHVAGDGDELGEGGFCFQQVNCSNVQYLLFQCAVFIVPVCSISMPSPGVFDKVNLYR